MGTSSAREIKNAKEMLLRENWKRYGKDYQMMYTHALKMACVGATAAPCERNWSSWKYIYGDRPNLEVDQATMLVAMQDPSHASQLAAWRIPEGAMAPVMRQDLKLRAPF